MGESSAGSPPAGIGVVPRGAPAPEGVRRLSVLLVHPSKYDDDGYVLRFVRGVLPTNTLAVLAGLTEEVAERGALGRVAIECRVLDELVQRIDVRALARECLSRRSRAVVALCGVQTNQFPRAADLARRFRAAGFQVLVGGFHVSGSIALATDGMPPECRALADDGIALVKGEVEECWEDLLRDALHGSLRDFYDVVDPPDLRRAGLPTVDPGLMRRFAYPRMGTIDAGRGCPFHCSFCTIIHVQGHRMRCRSAEAIRDRIRRNAEHRIDYYFFTDDNFSRNPEWEGVFDALADLRRSEGIAISFMMQVDVLAHRIPGFAAKAAEAGCTQVFVGVETMDPENLSAAGKRQNRVEDYREMASAWHAEGIACHAGYIIGFPHDTPEKVREATLRLRDEVEVDQASFFMLTPLPGSRDHAEMLRRGDWMDDDLNRFDSFHPTTRHPRMTAAEWLGAYRRAWTDFYSVDGMKSILSRANARSYWGLFKNFAWYKYAFGVEDTAPMVCGFLRIKDRKDRRPGFAVEPVWKHWRRRARDARAWARGVVRLYFELQEVWLATRGRSRFQAGLEGLRKRYEEARDRFGDSAARAGQALGRQIADARAGAEQAIRRVQRTGRATGGRREAWGRALRRVNLLAVRTSTRAHLDAYWAQTWDKLRRGRILRINPLAVAWNAARDAKLCAAFSLSVLAGYGK